MKNHLLSLKLALLAVLVAGTAMTAAAYDFLSGGIYYQINGTGTVSVTYKTTSYNSYSGTVNIPSSVVYNSTTYQVTEIGQNAFAYSSGLTAVTIPNTVKTIGRQAFGITGLKSITIPNSVTTVDANVFYNCTALETVTIGTGVKTLTNYMFFGCSKLTKVEVPTSVTEIGTATFKGCVKLADVTLGSGVTKVGSTAFAGCTALTKVTCLSSTPPTMSSSDCFDSSTYSGATLSVPAASLNTYKSADWWRMFNTINAMSFDFCVNGIYYKKTSSNTVAVTYKDMDFYHYSGSVTVPSTVSYGGVTYRVTAVGEFGFYLCRDLTSVTLPSTIVTLGDCAFEKCSSLTTITIPASVTTLGVDAFASCTSLKSIVLPNSVTKIGNLAFYNCTAMTSATLGSGVTTINEKAFAGCSALTTVTCLSINPPTMNSSNCFDASTYSSATLYVPGGSLNTYKSADWWRMFNTVSALPFDFLVNGIYYKKTSGNTVEVTYKDTNFGSYSGSVSIPSSITVSGTTYRVAGIGVYAFYNCKNLTSISMPASITYINVCAFEKCSALTTVTIPEMVTILGTDAFASCTGLKSIEIPNSVTKIDQLAFYNCTGMTSVKLGTGVKNLGQKAFSGCTALTDVTCYSLNPPVMTSIECFDTNTYSKAKLTVPQRSLNSYKSADWWRMFTTIVGGDFGGDPADVNSDGEVNIADVNAVIDAILSGVTSKNFDANNDGEVNIADVNEIIDAILSK